MSKLGRSWWASLTLGATYLALLVASAPKVGYTRDEAFYIQFARLCEGWLVRVGATPAVALGRAAVDNTWRLNHEHPSFAKLLFTLGHLLLQRRLHLFALDGTAYRFGAMLLGALLLAAVHHHAARRLGAVAGLVAALSLGFMPRFFFHAHLACLDVPVAALTTLTAFAYLRSLRTTGLGAPLATGLLFGLALATKHTALLLPPALVAHLVLTGLAARAAGRPVAPMLARGALALAAMATVGVLVLVAVWPWLWHAPLLRLAEWLAFHRHHEHYDVEYLGVDYWKPPLPRSYAWLLTLATVPTVTLAATAFGLAYRAQRFRRGWRALDRPTPSRDALLYLCCVIAFYAPWLSSSTPIFGGTKHWLTAYPFLALFAATAAARSLALLRGWLGPGGRALVPALLALSLLAAPAVEAWHALPFGLGGYVPLVGGAAGAASLGLQRGFWGYGATRAASLLDRQVPAGGHVYLHDTMPLAFRLLAEEGRLRDDLVGVSTLDDADAALYQDQPVMRGQEYKIWEAFGSAAPADIQGLDGVPMLLVYQRVDRSSNSTAPAPSAGSAKPPR